MPALPTLIAKLKDPETKVRAAVVGALHSLGPVAESVVSPLATALAGEADAAVRVAIVGALEAIAPGTPPVLAAHLNALRDPDPAVRKAGATFRKVPANNSIVSALETALGDPNDEVRNKVAGNLTEVLFSSSAVIPALFKALRDPTRRQTVLEALGNHLENTSDSAAFSRVRGDLAGLKTTLSSAIPAIVQVLSLHDDEISPLVYGLLGRIVSFSGLSRDADLRKAIEPALQVYLHGLDESIPAIREEVLGSLEEIPIRHADIVTALRKFLEKPDLTRDDRQSAVRALEALAEPAPSKTAKGSRRG
jgi:HEAT repeat protein